MKTYVERARNGHQEQGAFGYLKNTFCRRRMDQIDRLRQPGAAPLN